MRRQLVVGVADAEGFAERRGYLIELIDGLRSLGVEVRVAWVGDEAPPAELTAAAELRVLAPAAPTTAGRVAGSVARRLGSGFTDALHDTRARDDLEWLGAPDAIHLSGARSVALLHVLRHPGVAVVTYVHPHEFSIAGLSGPDQQLLVERTRRFIVADDAAAADLITAGADPERIERAPRCLRFPTPPPTDEQRRPWRKAFGLPEDRPVVAVAPVPDWFEAPDLTVALAWELRRRRGDAAPHLLWYGMPSEGEAHWAVQADLDRLRLDHVHLTAEAPTTMDLVALADVVVVPSRPTVPDDAPDLALAREHLLPVVCWDDSPVAGEVARWPGAEVPYPEVGPMADAVLALVEDGPERRRARNVRWRAAMADVEQFAPLEVPAP